MELRDLGRRRGKGSWGLLRFRGVGFQAALGLKWSHRKMAGGWGAEALAPKGTKQRFVIRATQIQQVGHVPRDSSGGDEKGFGNP